MKYLVLLLIAVIWGSQFVLNDTALQIVSPFELAFYRVLFGFFALSTIIYFSSDKKKKLVWTKDLRLLLVLLTLFESVIPLVLNAYGQQQVSSSVTAVLMASIPITTLVLEKIFNNRSIQRIELTGIVIGMVGLVFLVYPDLMLTKTMHYSAVLFILLGAFCFALALIIITRIPKEVSSLRFTRAVLFVSSVTLLPMIFIEHNTTKITTDLWLQLILLGSLASGVVYFLYLFLVRTSGAVFTSLTNFIVPIVGVFLGIFIKKDPFILVQYVGFGIILFGLVLINFPSLKTSKRECNKYD
jgi:drug/metabolite transporter (DMT)-like permease